jgi:hypothetical protein
MEKKGLKPPARMFFLMENLHLKWIFGGTPILGNLHFSSFFSLGFRSADLMETTNQIYHLFSYVLYCGKKSDLKTGLR